MTQQKIIVAALIVQHGKVLLAKRAATKRIAPGQYHLPGGHVEFGEEPTTALQREIKEELHVDIRVGPPVHTFAYTLGEAHTVGITYQATLIDPQQPMQFDPQDIEQIMWIDRSEISTYLEPDDHDYQAIMQGLRMVNELAQDQAEGLQEIVPGATYPRSGVRTTNLPPRTSCCNWWKER